MLNIALTCLSLLSSCIEKTSKFPAAVIAESQDSIFPRLTVNPKQDATGQENKTAGTTEIEGLSDYYIHVPPRAVGKKRVPLILLLHGGGRNGAMEIKKFSALADKHGMILLAATSSTPGKWDAIGYISTNQAKWEFTEKGGKPIGFQPKDVTRLDSALKHVLKTQAIDPERIALLGFSDGGSYSFLLGRSNLDIFSRVAPLSGLMPFYGEGPVNPNVQFFISGGLGEGAIIKQVVRMASVLRADGHAVKTQVGLRGHVDHVEDEDFVWQWLLDSWEDPKVTTAVPKPLSQEVQLTTDAVEKFAKFWDGFVRLSDSILGESRMSHQHEVPVRVGTEWTTVIMMDIDALSNAHPEVAALLKSAGLTAKEAQAYRTAIVEAHYTIKAGLDDDAVDPSVVIGKSIRYTPVPENSVLYKNIGFLKNNQAVLQRLASKKIFNVQ